MIFSWMNINFYSSLKNVLTFKSTVLHTSNFIVKLHEVIDINKSPSIQYYELFKAIMWKMLAITLTDLKVKNSDCSNPSLNDIRRQCNNSFYSDTDSNNKTSES